MPVAAVALGGSGGTPNLGEYVRAIPCAIFALPPELGGLHT